jgi:hypothetical protein
MGTFMYPHIGRFISTNNIARGMVRARRKYVFNPPKIRFHANKKLPTYATLKSKITVRHHLSPRAPLASLSSSP